ncbi:phage tail tape measure protein [Pantoea piersonii]|uniref:phage tail tape measure protein n=1 Tax=Pantoea piersonii TaxID=2364647 RepID=UPI0028AB5062|nr:phage tail tape measure protein [Pantoea piersonii]
MSDKNLRLQVVLGAVDKLTRPFRSARDSTRELAGSLRDTRNTLKELDAQAGRIDGFRKTRSQLAITANNLKAAREEAARLAVQFSETNRPTAAQARVLEQAKNRASQLQQTYNGLRISVQRQREALGAAGIDTKKLSQAQRELKSQSDEARAAIDRQQQSLKKLGERQAKLSAVRERYSRSLEVRDRVAGAGAATSAAGLAMVAPVAAAVHASAAMEDAMKGVAKQVNGLRDNDGNRTKQFYDMQAAIKAASEQLPMENGAIDYAALVEGGARMGVTNQNDSYEDQKRDLLAFATTAAKASTAFELPAGELAEGLGKIAQLYKIPTRNIEQLGDALNYLDDNAMSKGADIIDVMQRMGGVADRMNFRQVAALGSTFLTLGATSEIAASSANAMVRELSIATMQSNSFMDGMDLLKLDPAKIEKQMTTDAMGTIMRVLEKVKKLPNSKRVPALTMLFGKEFGPAAAKLVNNMPELRRQLALTQGDGAKGSMQKESDINKDSLSAQWMLTKTGVSNTMSGLGDSLRTPLMDIMDMVKKVTGVTRRWVENNKELAGTIVKAAAVISVVVIALGTLMIGLAAVLGPLALLRLSCNVLGLKALPGLASAASRAGSMLGWLGSAPLSLLRRGMGDAGGRVSLLAGPLASLRASAGMAGNALKAVAGAPMRLFRGAMRGVSAAAGMMMNPVAAGRVLLSGTGQVLRWLASGPVAVLRVALIGISWAMGALLSPVGLLVAALAGVALVVWKYWQPIKAFLGGVVEGFRAAAAPVSEAFAPLKPVFQWVGDKVQALFGWFRDLLTPVQSTGAELDSAAAKGKAFGQALADGLSMVMHPLDTLKSGVSWLLEKLGIVTKEAANAKLPEHITRQQAATVNADGKVVLPPGGFPRMYDTGGNIPSGQMGIVGENGPELINGPANVTSRRRTAGLAALAALTLGGAAAPATAAPLHPLSLPAQAYRQDAPRMSGTSAKAAPQFNASFTIVQQPGQSQQDLVDEVMRRLQAEQRKAEARERSSYRDRGGFEE